MSNRQSLIEERGGRCQNCGYREHQFVLRFVQINPILGQRKSLNKIIEDSSMVNARKATTNAILVCPTCAEIYRAGYFDIAFKPSEPPKIYAAVEVVDKNEPMNEYKDYQLLGTNPESIPSSHDWKRVWNSSTGKREAWASDSLKQWYKIES